MKVEERALEVQSVSLVDQSFRSVLFKKLETITEGRLEVVEKFNGMNSVYQFGKTGGPAHLHARITISRPRAYGRIALGGTVGGGESYMDGDWDCDHLTPLIRIFARNHQLHTGLDKGWGALTVPLKKLFHLMRNNSLSGAKDNIHAHYDIGNDFFELFLDSSYLYSSGIFKNEETTLEEAQFEKMDRICKKLELKPEDSLLEIGTGWGGFAIHAAKYYGCKVTTTTISEKQFLLAKERIAHEGLSGQVQVLSKDYRLLEGAYDKLVSIEMIEAVGLNHLEEYFAKCSALLKPSGQMLLQAITIRDQQFQSAKKNVDFVQRYIFPGSGIPSIESMSRALAAKTDFQLSHLEDFGYHYARTLSEWSKRLHANHSKLLQRNYSERLYRMWQYYFGYCEGGFHERNIGVVQMLLLKPNSTRSPLIAKI